MAADDADDRDTYLRRMCYISVVIIVLSSACIVVGCLSIVESAPKFLFPYCLGGAMIAGLFVISLAGCNIKLYCNYRKNSEHASEYTVKRWVCRQILLISLTGIALMIGIGISGIWGMVKATDVINFESKFNMTSKTNDVPYAKANLPYAISSFVLVLILSIVQTVLWCTCLCYTDTYGFTDNTTYHSYRATIRSDINSPSYEYRPRTIQRSNNENFTQTSNITGHNEELRVTSPGFRTPSAPSPDLPENVPISRSHTDEFYTVGHRPLNDNVNAISGQPPSYEQVTEEQPPSYNQVFKEGGFKVNYV